MRCDWEALTRVLPPRLRGQLEDRDRETGRELRLRVGQPGEVVYDRGSRSLPGTVARQDLEYIISAVTGFSPWAAGTLHQGYLTAPGGHRIGLCGPVILREGRGEGLREPDSACIRIARDVPGAAKMAENLPGSVLILAPPGWGKTTFLRDLIRQRGRFEQVAAADERGELFPPGFDRGPRTDVLTGCPMEQGVLRLLRTMSPQCLAVDEVTRPEDSLALCTAANCGVHLLATAHAGSREELERRAAYRPLLEGKCFDWFVFLRRDRTCRVERNGV